MVGLVDETNRWKAIFTDVSIRFDFLATEDVYRQISPFTSTRGARSETDGLSVAGNIRSFEEASTKRKT